MKYKPLTKPQRKFLVWLLDSKQYLGCNTKSHYVDHGVMFDKLRNALLNQDYEIDDAPIFNRLGELYKHKYKC